MSVQYAFVFGLISLCYLCLIFVIICYAIIVHTIRKFRESEEEFFQHGNSNKFVGRTPTSQRRFSEPTLKLRQLQRQNQRQNQRRRRFSAVAIWRDFAQHVLSRHKYILVIGTVLFVDILFLVPYSLIQMLSVLHLRNSFIAAPLRSALVRWILQILIGLHALCQPLCYFRMTEFRRFTVCFGGQQLPARISDVELETYQPEEMLSLLHANDRSQDNSQCQDSPISGAKYSSSPRRAFLARRMAEHRCRNSCSSGESSRLYIPNTGRYQRESVRIT